MLFQRALHQRYNQVEEIIKEITQNSDSAGELTVISYLQMRLREINADISTGRKSRTSIDHRLDELMAVIAGLENSKMSDIESYRCGRVRVEV